MDDLENERYFENELFNKYKSLAENYKKLLKLTRKSIKISDSQWKELKRREYEIRNLLDNFNQGFLTFGKDLLVNKEYSSECIRLFEDKISNKNIIELLCNENKEQKELFSSVLKEFFNEKDICSELECLKKLPNMLKIKGKYINVSYKAINIEESSEDSSIMLILTDITEKKRTEDQILYLSYHDKLTTLFNRTYIDNIIPQLQSESSMPLSVIMADMNGLKLTNDVFGHENGDKLLVNAAKAFMKSCRKTDIVARWGGDEFLIILPNTDDERSKEICKKIKIICTTFEPNPIKLSISLGSATMESPTTSLSELFNIAENEMYRNKLVESKDVRRKIILGLEKTLYEKCFEDYGHNERVKDMALNFAKLLNIKNDSREILNLSLFASLHDIGKVSIPKEILGKKISLTQAELDIVKRYTEIGFRMAQSIEEPVLAQCILCLRERWDGKGYPYGLKAKNIPLNSRIVSILESYDIMTHNRPYKDAICKEEALEELKRCSGEQFDPDLVKIFVENYQSFL
ncbi:diguanylate cyclase [Clostridiaceae bacterium UIB06]|uniref:Diguanylate cyclase n=2 Tax=Clostridium thailandense TaxID=2794346 RepID=A0A949X498_9CLOT|nr:diguanylate cyclase [Clostridium thailandense]MCH5137040.1 diguanylate cyclase [Clostridiaceae bacterium UIB06]